MATFKAVVFEHHKKEDGTYNAKIRVTHKRVQRYIDTSYYLHRKQISKDFKTIKDEQVENQLIDDIRKYRKIIAELGDSIELYDCAELKEYLIKKASPTSTKVDFIAFAKKHIAKLYKNKRAGTADSLQTTVNSLIDFFGTESIPTTSINAKSLLQYEEFLRSKRTINRPGKSGALKPYEKEPVSDTTVKVYMTNIRTLFNEAKKEFNDEDKGDIMITHYPFTKYKIPVPAAKKKRSLDFEIIKAIRNAKDEYYKGTHGTNRASFGRDMFMLTFYLIGINSVDLYNAKDLVNDRLVYRRTKTASRRKDEALISVKVEPEALDIIDKYRDRKGKRVFDFYNMYSNSRAFNKNANIGLKKLCELNEWKENYTLYYARHSWATIARNKCRISKDDIAMALNHVDDLHKTTDIYLDKDWTIIDEANRKVLDVLKS